MGFEIGQPAEISESNPDERYAVVVRSCGINLTPQEWGDHLTKELKIDPAEDNAVISIHMVAIKGDPKHKSVYNIFSDAAAAFKAIPKLMAHRHVTEMLVEVPDWIDEPDFSCEGREDTDKLSFCHFPFCPFHDSNS